MVVRIPKSYSARFKLVNSFKITTEENGRATWNTEKVNQLLDLWQKKLFDSASTIRKIRNRENRHQYHQLNNSFSLILRS